MSTQGNPSALPPFKSTPPAFAEKLNARFAAVEKSIPRADGHTILQRDGVLTLNHQFRGDKPEPFALVPALAVDGYTPNPDGKDWLRFYVAYGLLNGVRVRGTLEIDGSITTEEGQESILVTLPEDATNFVVYIKGQEWFPGWCGIPDDPPSWWNQGHCPESAPFVDDDNEIAPPEIGFGDQGTEGGNDETWLTYPCQPEPVAGTECSGLNHWGENGWSQDPNYGYKIAQWSRQPFRYPITRITGDGEGVFDPPVQNCHEYMIVDFFTPQGFYTYGQPADGTHVGVLKWTATFSNSRYIEEQPGDELVCAIDCPTGEGSGSGGGGGVSEEALEELKDAIERLTGHWLYRIYIVGDSNTSKVVAMQDGHLWTGGDDDPTVVSWGGAELAGSETEESPFVVALKVIFSNLTGVSAGPDYSASVEGDFALDMTPENNIVGKTPTGWPTGYTISNLDNGTAWLPIAYVWFDGEGKMVIKEAHRGNASFVAHVVGGDDGVTDTGFLIARHHASLLAGRVQEPIAPLLSDNCFSQSEVIGAMQLLLDASSPPPITYTLQSKNKTLYYYMGQLAYQKLDDDWADVGPTIDGWTC